MDKRKFKIRKFIVLMTSFILAFAMFLSATSFNVLALTKKYTYDNGYVTMKLVADEVSARMYSYGTASLVISGEYKCYYYGSNGVITTGEYISVPSYAKNGTDTGANNWHSSKPDDAYEMYALHNRFVWKSNLVVDETITRQHT